MIWNSKSSAPDRDAFYDSPKWLRIRSRILRRDKYMDAEAKRYGIAKPAEIVHHIFPKNEYPEYAFSEWNLISLSRKTHNEMHVRDTDELTAKGIDLLRRTCRKYGVEVPSKYDAPQQKKPRIKRDRYYDYH